MTNESILNELKKPFHPSVVEWKPQATTKDGTKAMAAAYADIRAYQNRLDEVCGMDWSVTYTPWGDRIVCHVTIGGVTRSSTGEGDAQSERSEIAGTAAEAQAFKRACAMFGLGRYLYNLPQIWVEIDPATKKFTPSGLAKLEGQVVAHYRRTMTEDGAQESCIDALNRLGKEFYAGEWEAKAAVLAETISTGQTKSIGDLKEAELKRLIVGIQDKIQKSKTTNGVAPAA